MIIKPLSLKALEKKYAELGLPVEKTDLLQEYFRCFANLYGVISVRDAWDVFRHYEGIGAIRRKDFAAFSGIVQREAGHPYAILELKEAYRGETTDSPLDRLIVNNRLIRTGYGKYTLLYNTVDFQNGKQYYLPAEKREFLAHSEDRFYLSPEGERMVRFLGQLKTNGIYKDYDGKTRGEILDVDGKSVAGKRLSDFAFYTRNEQFEIEYVKRGSQKEQLRREYRRAALDKLLDCIFVYLQTGGYVPRQSMTDFMCFILESMDEDYGISLNKKQLAEFADLFVNLNNRSHLWLNCGWRPYELLREEGQPFPRSISVGPNMKKMLENGELDREELERHLKEIGITASFE